ncbi:MAG: heavy metal translocating P-type ATPase, partial [Mycobacterium sp.]|nr:heavy metal translocating P-type ATPase [Mycobacterium sp.]
MTVARRSRAIALQSAITGMGLSLFAMGSAAVGLLPPVLGALLQEAIDVAVILNALRALRATDATAPLGVKAEQLIHRFSAE